MRSSFLTDLTDISSSDYCSTHTHVCQYTRSIGIISPFSKKCTFFEKTLDKRKKRRIIADIKARAPTEASFSVGAFALNLIVA